MFVACPPLKINCDPPRLKICQNDNNAIAVAQLKVQSQLSFSIALYGLTAKRFMSKKSLMIVIFLATYNENAPFLLRAFDHDFGNGF
jgi:hypothetical protein